MLAHSFAMFLTSDIGKEVSFLTCLFIEWVIVRYAPKVKFLIYATMALFLFIAGISLFALMGLGLSQAKDSSLIGFLLVGIPGFGLFAGMFIGGLHRKGVGYPLRD